MSSLLRTAPARFMTIARERGVAHAVKAARAAALARLDQRLDRAWDFRHRIDTCGTTQLRDLDIEEGSGELGFEYAPSPVSMIMSSLRRLPRTEGLTFVDFGSGKGRVLFVAAEFPFRRIIGIEFARQLHETALKNLASYTNPRQKCFEITPMLGDALNFAIPNESCVLYFYTPFKALLLEKILANVAASYAEHPRPVYVVYGYQIQYHLSMFDALPGFASIRPRDRLWSRYLPGAAKVHVYGTRETMAS
jgi:SAM-dependent methyltransferase